MADVLLNSNADEVIKELRGIREELGNIQGAQKDTQESIDASTESTGGLAKGFQGVGLAIKAAGIGLALEAFQFLKDAIGESQIATDFFSTAFNFASTVVQDFITFVTNNIGRVTDFFDAFSLPSISEIGTAIQNNLTERFESALEVMGFLGSAAIKFFSGDFAGALDDVQEAGKEFADVLTGVDDTVDKVTEAVTTAVNAVVDYTTSTYEAAAAQTTLANSAAVAAAQSALTRAENEAEAESLRQVRDNTNLTFEARLEASERLREVLEADLKARTDLTQADVDAAQQAFDNNMSIENQVALLEAQAKQIEVLAEVEGKRSEQLSQQRAIEDEQAAASAEMREERQTRELEILEAQGATSEELYQARLERAETEEEQEQLMHERRLERYEEDAEAKLAADEAKAESERLLLDVFAKAGDFLTTVAGENKDLAIAGLIIESSAAVAETIINTFRAAAKVKGQTGVLGIGLAPLIYAQGALEVATQVAATQQGINAINSAESGSGVSGVAGAGGATSVPFGPTVNTPGVAASAPTPTDSFGAQSTTPEPARAYILESDVGGAAANNARIDKKQRLRRS